MVMKLFCYLDYSHVSIMVVVLQLVLEYVTFAGMETSDRSIISYEYKWIYNYLKIKSLIFKKVLAIRQLLKLKC